MRYFFLVSLAFFVFGVAQEISLVPADPEPLGNWAQVARPLRLYPTLAKTVHHEGPALAIKLFGEIALGEAQYIILLGISAQNEVALWVDFDGNSRLTPAEKLEGTRISRGLCWSFVLQAKPKGAEPYEYPLLVVWPEGRGYVFVMGGAPRLGIFSHHQLVLVDGDLNGVFGTKGDFLGLDIDKDGKIYADPDGHEYFALSEAFTLGSESFKVQDIAPDGRKIRLEKTAYVPPKIPLIPGSPAPNFSFRDFLSGRELSLQSFRGKVVLLDFWATWCPPCMASLPGLRKIYEEFHAQGFEIVGVSLDESEKDLRRVLTEYGIAWPVAFEANRWNNSVANLYRVYQIPTAYLIDKNGAIRHRDLGGEELRQAVAELLKEVSALPHEGEPILAIQAPGEVIIRSKEESLLELRIVNASSYLAEGVRLSLEGLPQGIGVQRPDPFDLPAFAERTVRFALSPGKVDPQISSIPITVHVNYRYSVAETCFEVKQTAKTTVIVEVTEATNFAIPWWVLALLVAGVIVAFFLFGGNFFSFSSLAARSFWKR